jgi:hypothetical protein
MKKSLLATVAAVALIAGAGMASAAEGAKDQPKDQPKAGHAEMQKAPAAKGGAQLKGRAETNGSGASEMKAEPRANADVKGKAGAKAELKSEKGKSETKAEMKSEKAKPATTGAGPTENGKADTKADMKSKSSTTGANETKSGVNSKAAADTKANGKASTTGQAAAGATGSVTLTSEQKTKIRTTVIESKGAPKVSRSSINFNIRVGTVVPRDRVHYVAVSPTLIDIHPEWRGHYYFVVDEEIIIVDSHGRIVAVLDV